MVKVADCCSSDGECGTFQLIRSVFRQLLDLCMMDIGWLDYSYSVLAAAAFCHFSTFDIVHKVSGTFSTFQLLIWLLFSYILVEKNQPNLKLTGGIPGFSLCRPDLGERVSLLSVDESLHGDAELWSQTSTQELPQSQIWRQTQHPNSRGLPGPAGERRRDKFLHGNF